MYAYCQYVNWTLYGEKRINRQVRQEPLNEKNPKSQIPNLKFQNPKPKSQIQNSKFKIQNSKFQIAKPISATLSPASCLLSPVSFSQPQFKGIFLLEKIN